VQSCRKLSNDCHEHPLPCKQSPWFLLYVYCGVQSILPKLRPLLRTVSLFGIMANVDKGRNKWEDNSQGKNGSGDLIII
jgi:hypothetical protein